MSITAIIKNTSRGLFGGYVQQRIRKNKNFLAVITGPTGSGKTYSALSLAEKWDTGFNKLRIVFTIEEFLDLLENGKLKKGDVILWEEVGVALNSRQWQSKGNNFIQFILQTFRSDNYILLMTAPDLGFVDSASRKLLHCHMMTTGINFTRKICNIRPYLLQINQRTGQVFYKFLMVLTGKSKSMQKIRKLEVSMPSKGLVKEYEQMKREYNKNLQAGINKEFHRDKNKEKDEKNNVIEEKKKERMHIIKSLRDDGASWTKVGKMFGMGESGIRQWYKRVSEGEKA